MIKIVDIMNQLIIKDRFFGVRNDIMKGYMEYMSSKWTSNWFSFCDLIRDYESIDMPTSEKEKAILRLAFNYKDALNYDIGYSRPSRRNVRIKDVT